MATRLLPLTLALLGVLLPGCLERVTGEAVPLDPRFYEGVRDGDDQPQDPNAAGGGDAEGPWSGYEGETVLLRVEIVADGPGVVQIDVNEPDAEAPGGQRRAGALHLPIPETFELNVPTTVKVVRIQAFQDPNADGPGEDDPFAEVSVDLTKAPPEAVVLKLVVGARGSASGPGGGGGGSPGSPGGGPGGGGPEGVGPGGSPTGSPAPPPNGLSFPEGPMVTVTGTVQVTRDLPVILDFWRADGTGQGGRTYLGKRMLDAGPFSQDFPVGYGPVEIEAYQDLTEDSRSGDDPAARLERPLVVGSEPVSGLILAIP